MLLSSEMEKTARLQHGISGVQSLNEISMRIEALLEKPYWIVDILPKQVPENSEGQYFKVEQYYLRRLSLLCRKYVDMLLKLNCYFDINVSHDGERWVSNPEPESFVQWIGACLSETPTESSLFVTLLSGEVLLVLERDNTSMTVYNPTEDVLGVICQLAASEGQFVWQPKSGT